MEFDKTYTRAPKGVKTPKELGVPDAALKDLKQLGTFGHLGDDLVLKFTDGTQVLMRLQKVTTYSVKKPRVDDFNRFVPPPADNEDEEPAAPAVPGAPAAPKP
jgi:hypothetical protein